MQSFLRELWADSKTTMIMVTHNIEEAILVGERIIVLGGQPARILKDINTSKPTLKDRYSNDFLVLQKEFENLIDADPDSEKAEAIDKISDLKNVR